MDTFAKRSEPAAQKIATQAEGGGVRLLLYLLEENILEGSREIIRI
jgi:hypothetical protein